MDRALDCRSRGRRFKCLSVLKLLITASVNGIHYYEDISTILLPTSGQTSIDGVHIVKDSTEHSLANVVFAIFLRNRWKLYG